MIKTSKIHFKKLSSLRDQVPKFSRCPTYDLIYIKQTYFLILNIVYLESSKEI